MLEVLPKFWLAAVWRTGSSWVEQAASEEGELLALYFLDSSWVRRYTGSTTDVSMGCWHGFRSHAEPETGSLSAKMPDKGCTRTREKQSGVDIWSGWTWTGPSEGRDVRPPVTSLWLPWLPQVRWEIPSNYATRCARGKLTIE